MGRQRRRPDVQHLVRFPAAGAQPACAGAFRPIGIREMRRPMKQTALRIALATLVAGAAIAQTAATKPKYEVRRAKAPITIDGNIDRSEERRVGKECRTPGSP